MVVYVCFFRRGETPMVLFYAYTCLSPPVPPPHLPLAPPRFILDFYTCLCVCLVSSFIHFNRTSGIFLLLPLVQPRDSSTRLKSAGGAERRNHHLYFSLRHFGCSVGGEELEIYFSLYDMQNSCFIRYDVSTTLTFLLLPSCIVNIRVRFPIFHFSLIKTLTLKPTSKISHHT